MAEFPHYFDSGLLVKIYHLEPGSPEVCERVRQAGRLPLPFLGEMEIRNALRVLHGRKQLTGEKLSRALALMDADIREGRLVRVSPDPIEVAAMAESLSRLHAPATLCRTLDLLHVAIAKTLNIPCFHTGDRRRGDLAQKAELKVYLMDGEPG